MSPRPDGVTCSLRCGVILCVRRGFLLVDSCEFVVMVCGSAAQGSFPVVFWGAVRELAAIALGSNLEAKFGDARRICGRRCGWWDRP